jgi:hypothetical protein
MWTGFRAVAGLAPPSRLVWTNEEDKTARSSGTFDEAGGRIRS